ncbi:MAG TPA: phosphatidylserine decarboxylase [Methylophilaceae bacterium]|nr:phosphatidylserine decarboxylase [Methylophilaceae bacterium]HAJ72360.1 phosphatidylserine decarboxylase [Methylophilaceae bacterium]
MKLNIILQYALPKQALTMLAGKLANFQAGALTTAVIGWFVKRYQVNMAEAANPDIASYTRFNDFFTRPLKPNARPLAKADFICPVDGAISQFGNIEKDQIFQAKGHYYSTLTLLAGQQALAEKFENGHFACLYLSPKDYHRIHMPCDGTLKSMTYVPGDLFSVNPTTAANVPNLFARNERVVCEFESSQHGSFVMVLVGATIVGSMATVWHDAPNGIINPPRSKHIRSWRYEDKNIKLTQGDEMGRFLLGSTVVLLFQKSTFAFNSHWQPSKTIRLGEEMASARPQ